MFLNWPTKFFNPSKSTLKSKPKISRGIQQSKKILKLCHWYFPIKYEKWFSRATYGWSKNFNLTYGFQEELKLRSCKLKSLRAADTHLKLFWKTPNVYFFSFPADQLLLLSITNTHIPYCMTWKGGKARLFFPFILLSWKS